ncbi:MAG TPA: hypothetical protein DGO43_03005 [Chloroflexi bacterium]|nr:hypothetical protein [Chloroflexota bacterium]
MSDNLQKLLGLVAMTVLVVLGVVLTNDDDTDFSRNRSFRETAGTFAGADRVEEADCCDQTLALLGSMQTQLANNSSQLAEISSQLQTHLSEESEASTSGASPDVQQIADQMAETCPLADPATWGSGMAVHNASRCVREYLVGFPLELARQVVLAHGTFGFFQRWNFDLGDPNKTSYSLQSQLGEVTTEEACGPIFYGYNPPPRAAVAVDTYQGVVLPVNNQFGKATSVTGYIQDLELAESSYGSSNLLENMYWPSRIESYGYCQ